MSLIPFVRFEVHTRLSPDEIVDALRSRIRPRWNILAWIEGSRFYGWAEVSDFHVFRCSVYPHGGMAVAVGRVSPVEGGSVVRIALRLKLPGIAFLGIWLAILAPILLFVLWQSLTNRPAELWAAMVAGVVWLGVPLLVLGGFWLDAGKMESILRSVLEQSPEP